MQISVLVILFFVIYVLPQVIGRYLANKYQRPNIRRVVFVVHVLLYFIIVYLSFLATKVNMEASAKTRCGNWMLVYFGAILISVSIPLTYLQLPLFKKFR